MNFGEFSELYEALRLSLEREQLDTISERTCRLLLAEFEQSGIQLASVERKQFVKLSDEIFEAGTNFVDGCERPVKLSSDEQNQFGVRTSHLNGPWTQQVDRRLRWFSYRKYFEHNEQQETFLRRLVSARHNLALLTNFQSFAHRAQSNSLLGTYENVHSFLGSVIEKLVPKCAAELAEAQQIVQKCSLNCDAIGPQLNECDVEFATAERVQSSAKCEMDVLIARVRPSSFGQRRNYSTTDISAEKLLMHYDADSLTKLENPPSLADGINREMERDIRYLGCELIQSGAILLPATAQKLFQRYYYLKSFVRYNFEVFSVQHGGGFGFHVKFEANDTSFSIELNENTDTIHDVKVKLLVYVKATVQQMKLMRKPPPNTRTSNCWRIDNAKCDTKCASAKLHGLIVGQILRWAPCNHFASGGRKKETEENDGNDQKKMRSFNDENG
ncbi:hypothetical protein niasHS_012393 [Heterodera schachtii]|uniref:Peptidase M3A/M3B catalytic domain-containing protein n=1 Tax=Heterodera schachtii TaxID=97005 RepID=A0ABD2IVQ8_HETSC